MIDGDTYDFITDLGVTVRVQIRVRLKDFDTAEIFHPRSDAEKEHGLAAQAAVIALIEGQPTLIRTYRTSSGSDLITVGRYVADVYYWPTSTPALGWRTLAVALAAGGFAKKAVYP